MKRAQFKEFANDQPACQVEDRAASDSLNGTDMQEYESSAGVYERRWRQKIKYDRRDLWIAVTVYLLVASVAFVVI